jgi:hypothetical protein
MPSEMIKQPMWQIDTPLEDQQSTIKTMWGFKEIEFSSTGRTLNTTQNTLDQSGFNNKQPDRIDMLLPVDYAQTLTLTDTVTATITKDGKITFSAAPDNGELIEYYMQYEISELRSLRSIQIVAPGIDPSQKYLVELYDGDPDDSGTKIDEYVLDVTRPVNIQRGVYYDFSNDLYINIILTGHDDQVSLWTGDGSQTVWFLNKARQDTAFSPVIVSLDYKNEFESTWTALFAGLATMALSASTELLPIFKRLANSPAWKRVAARSGIAVVEAMGVYVSIYAYMVDQGIRQWSEFSFEGILASLNTIETIGVIGSVAGEGLLRTGWGVPAEKAKSISSLAIGGGRNMFLASAFLTYLGTVRRYHSPV